MLLEIDPQMLYMMDVRGSCPLSYVPENDYEEWILFFKVKMDAIWPVLETELEQTPPGLSLQLPNSRQVQNPKIVLPPVFIEMLASGRMHPEEAMFLRQTYEDDEDLLTYVDEETSLHGASFGEDLFHISASSLDDVSETSTPCNYDDVSLMSPVGNPKGEECQHIHSISSIAMFESPSNNCDQPREPMFPEIESNSYDPNPCRMKHPMFPTLPVSQFGIPSSAEHESSCDQIEIQNAVFNPILTPPKVHKRQSEQMQYCCAVTEQGMDVIGIVDAYTSSPATPNQRQQLSKKGIFCLPDEDSGLLFGSC